jgi:hypothetical protein
LICHIISWLLLFGLVVLHRKTNIEDAKRVLVSSAGTYPEIGFRRSPETVCLRDR